MNRIKKPILFFELKKKVLVVNHQRYLHLQELIFVCNPPENIRERDNSSNTKLFHL